MTPDPDFLQSLTEALENAGLGSFLFLMLASAASVAIGRSLILLANRVSPWRLVLGLGVSALRFLVACALWVSIPYVLGRYLWNSSIPLDLFMVIVAVAFAPLGSAWLGLVPYFGRGILRFLYLLSFTLLFLFLILLGFENRVFIMLPLGFVLMSVVNLVFLNPLQSIAAGRKLVFDFRGFRA